LTVGNSVENESFRLLVPDIDKGLFPVSIPFAKHVNVGSIESIEDVPDAELAPSIKAAAKPVDAMRRAYTPVPQVKSLKRRWMPSGASSKDALSAARAPVQSHAQTTENKEATGGLATKREASNPATDEPNAKRLKASNGKIKEENTDFAEDSGGQISESTQKNMQKEQIVATSKQKTNVVNPEAHSIPSPKGGPDSEKTLKESKRTKPKRNKKEKKAKKTKKKKSKA